MDNNTIVIIGLIVVIVALLDDLQKTRAKIEPQVKTKTVTTEVLPITDGFVYPWWRNYYFGPMGSYWSPFRIY